MGHINFGSLKLGFCSNWFHDPKTGRFTGSGQLDSTGFYPSNINRTINDQDYVVIEKSKITLSGKTYTSKAVGNHDLGCVGLSLTTRFDGTYISALKTSYKFKNGLIAFSKNDNQSNDLDDLLS